MLPEKLLTYISEQKNLGKTQAEITAVLLSAGWLEADVNQAFKNLNTPSVPTPTTGNTKLPPIKTLFTDSLNLFKNRFWVMLASFIIPVLAVMGLGLVAFFISFLVFKSNTLAGIIFMVILGGGFLVAYIYTLAWGMASEITALRDAVEKTGIKENLTRAKSLSWSVLLVNILSNFVIMGGVVLLIIPGIIFSIRYGLALIVMVVEGKKGRLALAQSKAYVYGRTWKVFGRIILLNILFAIPVVLLNLIITHNNKSPIAVIGAVLMIALQIFFTFFSLCYVFTLYNQLKSSVVQTGEQPSIKGIAGWAIWGGISSFVLPLLLAIVLLSLNAARAKARDEKRLTDVQAISVALKIYYSDYHKYPDSLETLTPGYLPTPITAPEVPDGTCTKENSQYLYTPTQNLQSYELQFCLGLPSKASNPGVYIINPDAQSPIPVTNTSSN